MNPTSAPTSLSTSGSPLTAAADDGSDAAAVTAREWLSALADGQVDALQPACEAWRRDPEARAAWHGWQLIGDVMRSDELAQTGAHDAAFLARLRERLADEPVPLAPAPLPSRIQASGATAAAPSRLGLLRRRQAWLAPAAVAAGFVAVAGALLVVQMSGPEMPGTATTLAEAQRGGSSDSDARLRGVLASAGVQAASVPAPVMDSQFIRDAQIDRLLDAHRGAMGGAMVVPGGMKRHLDPVMPAAATWVVPGPAAVAEPAPLR